MKKRLLSCLLSFALIFSLLPATVFAAEPCLKVSATSIKAGDEVKVTYTVPNEVTPCSVSLEIYFETAYFQVESIVPATIANASSSTSEPATSNTIGKVTMSALNMVGDPFTIPAGTVLVTIVFKARAGVSGSASFTVGTAADILTDEAASSLDAVAGLDNTPVSVSVLKAPIADASAITAKVADPVKDVALDTAVDLGGATAYVGAVEWYKGESAVGTPVTGPAAAKQIYTAKITLTAKTADGESFDASLGGKTTADGYKIGFIDTGKLELTKTFPATDSVKVTKVQIAGTAPTLNVPEAKGIGVPGTVTVTNTYSVTVHTDDGILSNPAGVEWSVSGLDGVTVDPATGGLTISSDCLGGQIKLTATYGGVSDTATPTVFRDTPAVKWLKIVDKETGGTPQATIIRPVGSEPADTVYVEYEARVYDQFSKPATITKVDWTWDSLPKHMGTLETVGGPYRLRLNVFHNTETISFDLTATLKANPAIKDTVTIKVEERPVETLTVTQADTTYGTALADPVFTEPEGTIKTTIHYSTPTSSAYSSASKPTDAGEYVVNVVCETATHIYMGHANFKISPKSISNMLQPITGTYVYDGTPQKPTAVVKDGEVTLIEGTDYNVRYDTNVHVFEAATVYVDGIGNYTGTFSRNFKIQPKPIDITSVSTTNRDYEKDNVNVDCTVTLPVASDVKQGEHYHVFATMADDTAGTGKTVNVLVKMEKGGLGENYTLNKDTTTATVNINKINPADPTGLKGVKGQKLSDVELPAGWTWYAPSTVMDTAGTQTFLVNYTGDTNHNSLHMHPITVNVLDKTDVSAFITFPNGEKEYTGSWMKYEEASISGTNLGTGAKWNYAYTAGTGTLMAAGFPEGIGTYTVTATYEDSINFGSKSATLTITPKKVAIPAADTTVFTYDGNAKTYGISDTADYSVSGNVETNANETGYTVTVALTDKTNTVWADSMDATDKTYTFIIKQAVPTGEPKHTPILVSGKTLADAALTDVGGSFSVPGTVQWVADDGVTPLADTTEVAANTDYKWLFTPADAANYTTITGTIRLYSKSTGGGGGGRLTRYTVTFESNGGSKVSSREVYKNDAVSEPTAPTKAGYDFGGWYTDKALTEKYDFSTKVRSNFKLYAKWTAQDNTANQIILTIDQKDAMVFGKKVTNDVAPKIVNDRTMLPARFVAENLGATVFWDGDQSLVTIIGKNEKDETVTISFVIGASVATVNGVEVKFDTPAFIENNRTYTPIRFISERLGAKVDWIAAERKAVITRATPAEQK